MNIYPVILCGGSGTRLWPLSRKQYPKQFLSLIQGQDISLLQLTIKRIQEFTEHPPLIISNEEHRFIVAEQLRTINCHDATIILESEAKNTAPAIALAAFYTLTFDKDAILLVLAADHIVEDSQSFHTSINQSLSLVMSDRLVTFGVVPTHPETGYGYIQKGLPTDKGFEVKRFIEKPSLDNAQTYFQSKDYFWNSGMFVFKSSTYLLALEQYAPKIYESCFHVAKKFQKDNDFIRVDKNLFGICPSDSIDYAVLEKATNVALVELNSKWSDVGAWDAVWEANKKDEQGNVLIGDIIAIDCKKSLVHAKERLVSVLGLENIVVIDTKNALLIAERSRTQEIKKVVEYLQDKDRDEAVHHRVVHRPWGHYDSIDNGERYQVKRIQVMPGAKLSVQLHYHRAEHWIVVSGTALITNGDKTFMLSENQSTYIPAGVIHSLENPGKIPLEIIEVQSGSYLGEDDIVRFEDKYGRN